MSGAGFYLLTVINPAGDDGQDGHRHYQNHEPNQADASYCHNPQPKLPSHFNLLCFIICHILD